MKNYSSSISQVVNKALTKTFLWMAFGLALTGLVSFFLSTTSFMKYFLHASVYGYIFQFIILGAQLGLCIALFFGFNKFSYNNLVTLFLSFSTVSGMSLSLLFVMYELSSIIGIFFITAGMFFGLALYGLLTKKDFSPLYGFINMVIWGMLLFSLINIFFIKSVFFSNALALIGIIIFSGLTILDIQTIKTELSQYAYDQNMQNKLAILGALRLYQNFLNLFIRLLHLFGKRKNK